MPTRSWERAARSNPQPEFYFLRFKRIQIEDNGSVLFRIAAVIWRRLRFQQGEAVVQYLVFAVKHTLTQFSYYLLIPANVYTFPNEWCRIFTVIYPKMTMNCHQRSRKHAQQRCSQQHHHWNVFNQRETGKLRVQIDAERSPNEQVSVYESSGIISDLVGGVDVYNS